MPKFFLLIWSIHWQWRNHFNSILVVLPMKLCFLEDIIGTKNTSLLLLIRSYSLINRLIWRLHLYMQTHWYQFHKQRYFLSSSFFNQWLLGFCLDKDLNLQSALISLHPFTIAFLTEKLKNPCHCHSEHRPCGLPSWILITMGEPNSLIKVLKRWTIYYCAIICKFHVESTTDVTKTYQVKPS